MDRKIYKKAKKRVAQKKGFYSHLGSFIAVNLFLFLLNILTFEGDLWFFFPLISWGVGLLIHYFTVFGLPGTKVLSREWEEEELDKEIEHLERMKYKTQVRDQLLESKPEKSDQLELRDLKKQKEELFDEEDLV